MEYSYKTSGTCSREIAFEIEDGKVTRKNQWGRGTAQMFASVSPAMHDEFEIEYAKEYFDGFGLVYYGCCDRLDDRLPIIDRMPKIRKISCSPWSDREHFAAVLPRKYIMSNKPNPSYLAQISFDEDVVRADLRRTIKAAKENGLCLEFLLKDITTVKNEPLRLDRWHAIVKEEIERFGL